MQESIFFRPLERTDFPRLQRWMMEPHVIEWWHESLDLVAVEAKYGARIDGTEPTHVYVIEFNGNPIGWIQWYRWSDYPNHARQLGAELESAGIDLAIGELKMIGLGIGSSALSLFVREKVFVNPDISAVVTDPEEGNLRSLRAFAKAGFVEVRTVKLESEDFRRKVVRLERPTF